MVQPHTTSLLHHCLLRQHAVKQLAVRVVPLHVTPTPCSDAYRVHQKLFRHGRASTYRRRNNPGLVRMPRHVAAHVIVHAVDVGNLKHECGEHGITTCHTHKHSPHLCTGMTYYTNLAGEQIIQEQVAVSTARVHVAATRGRRGEPCTNLTTST